MGLTLDDGITLLDGTTFNFDHPENAENINISVIGTALSNICRFAGQLPYFYSVAQHAVNVSRIVPPEHAFTGLMHDTAEAFTNDIVKPLKHKVPFFAEVEERIERDMARRFGFTYPLPEAVHLADRQMLGLEMTEIRGMKASDWQHLNGIEFEHLRDRVWLTEMTPREACTLFLARYEELKST